MKTRASGIKKYSLSETALVLMDVQKEFCDPRGKRGNAKTVEIAGRIAALAPVFRRAGMAIYAVYFGPKRKPHPAHAHFYKFRFIPGRDILVPKNDDHTFLKASNIDSLLKQRGHRHLLMCGFNLASCVTQTACFALKAGYAVSVLGDLVGNDKLNTMFAGEERWQLDYIKSEGAIISHTTETLKMLGLKMPKIPAIIPGIR